MRLFQNQNLNEVLDKNLIENQEPSQEPHQKSRTSSRTSSKNRDLGQDLRLIEILNEKKTIFFRKGWLGTDKLETVGRTMVKGL